MAKACMSFVVALAIAEAAPAQGAPAPKPASPRPVAAGRTPQVRTVPDLAKGPVDPYDAVGERLRFFKAAGPDNELDPKEFSAAGGRKDSFVRKFDRWEAMLAHDKDGKKTIDWFEADAYRRKLRERVLKAFDANKDQKLQGAERDKANAMLAAGRLPGETRATSGRYVGVMRPGGFSGGPGPGDMSTEERSAAREEWQSRRREEAERRRREAIENNDVERDGQPDQQGLAKSIEELRQARDLHGLVARLADEQGNVRSRAAVALSGAVREAEDEAALRQWIAPLTDATLQDTHAAVREYAGRALMSILRRVDDERALLLPVDALIDTLDRDGVALKSRQYAAVALSTAVPKIKTQALLGLMVPPLVTATTEDPDKGVREYAGRALMSILRRVDDERALLPPVDALIDTLDRDGVALKSRQYAAVALWTTVPKIKTQALLEPMVLPLVTATTGDGDEGVREYAGRALLSVVQRVDDEAALEPALQPLVETLSHKEPKMHRYAAWALANLVPKIKDEAALKRVIDPLTAARLHGGHPHVREYCGRALRSIQARLKPRAANDEKDAIRQSNQ